MERQYLTIDREYIDDYTGYGPWEYEGEIYKKVTSFRTDGDGEWNAVIVQRESDQKYFRFDWGYSGGDYYYESRWNEVQTVTKTTWGWDNKEEK